jgi:hypothetical protein
MVCEFKKPVGESPRSQIWLSDQFAELLRLELEIWVIKFIQSRNREADLMSRWRIRVNRD